MTGIRDESLLEIATFLARRWSGKSVTVGFSSKIDTRTRLRDGKIVIIPMGKRIGSSFQRYRQMRTSLWYESMRVRFCEKILSNDHAFGFILNTMETGRIEELGRKIWRGMDEELAFNYAYMLASRPQLHTVYGRARIVEAFYQYFMFGVLRGEMQASHMNRIREAVEFAKGVVEKSVKSGHDTTWLEGNVSRIIRILDIDSLLTIPVSLPFMRDEMALTEKELLKFLIVIARNKGDLKADPEALLNNSEIYDEYTVLLNEEQRNSNRGVSPESIGIQVPTTTDTDESVIYDLGLISSLKTRFKEWKRGWKELHHTSGDELDEESYIEGHAPFYTDVKRSVKTKIVILLDHSSSISSDALEYKKATLALCEVLAFLKVRFAVYAFNTENRATVCWQVKQDEVRWNYLAAKRLARIVANGSTPLAEVYDKMFPIVQSRTPDIFLTLTDGEPSDPDAVRKMTKSLKGLGIRMVALGLGPNAVRSTTIAGNLGRLGYERTMAVSRLRDIPGKVINILDA